jgi:hypothetical protein
VLKIGLSWPAFPRRWDGRSPIPAAGQCSISARQGRRAQTDREIVAISRKGEIGETSAPSEDLEGIVLLDGTWSQAKALWWRNAGC